MGKQSNSKSLLVIIGVVFIFLGLFVYKKNSTPTKKTNSAPAVKYIGPAVLQEIVDAKTKKVAVSTALVKPGTTALELLQKTETIKINGEGKNAFITEINNQAADTAKKEYWAFSVNGKPATVGAGTYQLKDKDTIRWEIKNY